MLLIELVWNRNSQVTFIDSFGGNVFDTMIAENHCALKIDETTE